MDIKKIFGLEGENVLITGAGSGMGYAATKLLTELGANVYATVRRKPLDFPVTKEIKVELGDSKHLDALVDSLPGELEAVFLCHGIAQINNNNLQVQLVNFLSHKYLIDKLLTRIADNGSVTLISSNGGRTWQDDIAGCLEIIGCETWDEAVEWYNNHPALIERAYVFSKKCLHVYVMSKAHSPEFISRKIRLNALAAGNTITGLSEDFNKGINGNPEEGKKMIEKIFQSSWNGRWASAEEMGYPLVVMGSKICSYMSGQIIYFDYGMSSVWDFDTLKSKRVQPFSQNS